MRTPALYHATTPKKTLHPCLDCPLPDCDEDSKRCGLKRAISAYKNAMKQKDVTPQIRQRYNTAFVELYGRDRKPGRRNTDVHAP